MISSKILVGKAAQKEMLEGLSLVAEAIGSTLGPGGRPFVYDKLTPDDTFVPTFSKDGLTILRSLNFENPVHSAVLQFCKQAASHSVVASGDGTTSTILVANAVAHLIAKTDTKYPQAFARTVDKEITACIDAIQLEAIKSDEATKRVATTSANGDTELAEVVLEAISKSSAFGTLLVEKSPMNAERYKVLKEDGYSNCKGYDYNNTLAASADEAASSSEPIQWNNPYIAIFNGNIYQEAQLNPILQAWNTTLKDKESQLVVFCYELSDEVANKLLVINRTMAGKGSKAAVFVVKPRMTAETNSSLQILRDIASFTGISNENIIDGGNYKFVTPEYLGTCSKIRIGTGNTIISGRAPNHWVVKRIFQNEQIIADCKTLFDKQITGIRNAELAEGLVRVEIGGGMMPDLQERADRFDDASKAAQACMKEGALPGCGASYVRAAQLAGASPLLTEALREIHTRIVENFGEEVPELLAFEKGQTAKITEQGVLTGDCLELGVMDSVATVTAVLRNGCDLGLKIATLGGLSLRFIPMSEEV